MKVSGAAMTLFLVVGTIAFAAIAWQGWLGGGFGTQGQIQQIQIPGQQAPTTGSKLGLCSGINTLTLNVAVKDGLNASTNYLANSIRVIPTGGNFPSATGTANGSNSLSYAAVNVPCNEQAFSGKVYAVQSSTLNSAVKDYSITGTSGTAVLEASIGDELRVTMYDTTGATNTSESQAVSPTEQGATAMNSGDSRDGIIFVYPGNDAFVSYGTAGSDGNGIVWIWDSVDASAFTDNAFSMSSTSGYNLVSVQCTDPRVAKAASVDSGNRCWLGRPITTEDSVQKFAWTLRADGGGTPGATSDPILYVEDMHYFDEIDGTIGFGAFNSAGTNLGQSQTKITWDNS